MSFLMKNNYISFLVCDFGDIANVYVNGLPVGDFKDNNFIQTPLQKDKETLEIRLQGRDRAEFKRRLLEIIDSAIPLMSQPTNPMTTLKETCPKCGAEVAYPHSIHKTLFKCSSHISTYDQFYQGKDCRISELEKANAELKIRLRDNQLKTNGFDIEVSWYWGRSCSFKETAKFWSQTNDREEIKKHVLYLVNEIKDRYCFDCGDLSMPLNPSIGSVRVTPSVKIDSEYIYDEEVLQNKAIQDHASALLQKKGEG